jgi:hypothetical protein
VEIKDLLKIQRIQVLFPLSPRYSKELFPIYCERGEREFFTAVKGIYTYTTRSLRARSGISGKSGLSGQTPEIPIPLCSDQIFKEFDFVEIWNIAYVIYVSLSSINILD